MKKRLFMVLICILTSAILAACGTSQAEHDAQATRIAAEIFATQTAEAPTFTPTFTPEPSSTPTSTPEPTHTPTSTPTPTPTPTSTPKPTSTATPTPTPTPMLPALPAGWLDHTASGFSIALPERWRSVDIDQEGIESIWSLLGGIDTEWARTMTAMLSAETMKDLIKFWAMDSEPAGFGYATLNIIPQAQPFSIPVDDLCTQMPAVYKQMGVDMLEAECGLEINGLDAARFTVRFPMGALAVQEYQYVVLQGNETWTLTFAVDETEWAAYEPTFAGAAASFRPAGTVLQPAALPTPAPVAELGGTWYTTANGLVDNGVRSIAVAPDGALWLGSFTYQTDRSTGGVSRFDGQRWSRYTTADGLVDNGVLSVATAPDGTLWFGTRGGISHFDGKSWTNYTTADGLADDFISSVAIAPAPVGGTGNILWFGTGSGVSRFDGKSWTNYSTADGLPEGQVRSVAIASDGAVWACHVMAGVSRFDGKRWTNYTTADGLAHDMCLSITVAPALPGGTGDALWFGTLGGITRFDGQAWTTYSTADGLLDDHVNAFAVAPDGAWWFGTDQGITRFDGTTWARYDTVLERTDNLLLINAIDAIAVAPDGALWFGTVNGGALRYLPQE